MISTHMSFITCSPFGVGRGLSEYPMRVALSWRPSWMAILLLVEAIVCQGRRLVGIWIVVWERPSWGKGLEVDVLSIISNVIVIHTGQRLADARPISNLSVEARPICILWVAGIVWYVRLA